MKADKAEYPEIVSIDEITFVEIDGSELLLAANLVLSNENNFDISLIKIDAELFIDDDLIGRVKDNSSYKISKNGNSQLTFPAKIDLEKASLVFPKILDKDSVNISVKGKFNVDTVVTDIAIEMETEKEVSMRSVVNNIVSHKLSTDAFRIDKVSLEELGLLKTGLGLEINIKNDFAIDFEVQDIQCNLFIKGNQNPFGNWKHTQATIVKAQSGQDLEGQAQISNTSVLVQIASAMFDSQKLLADCAASVDLASYMFIVPFKQDIEIETAVGF